VFLRFFFRVFLEMAAVREGVELTRRLTPIQRGRVRFVS